MVGPLTSGGRLGQPDREQHRQRQPLPPRGDPLRRRSDGEGGASALTVTDSVLDYNKRALWYENSTGVITATKFFSNTEYAIYETGSGLTIQGNEFRRNKHGVNPQPLQPATGRLPATCLLITICRPLAGLCELTRISGAAITGLPRTVGNAVGSERYFDAKHALDSACGLLVRLAGRRERE